MVRELIKRYGLDWTNVLAIIATIGAIVTFAIRLGSTETRVEINGGRISGLESVTRTIEGKQFQGLAIQDDHNRRLVAIENHDVQTREGEAKILERLSKLEAAIERK